jgi:hypothetical protein
MEGEKQKSENDAVEAKLLADAIKELNISKRNVALYSRDHPLTKESIERAFRYLQKLFESKGNIALGIAKDTLMLDGAVLDKKNPALKEFAMSLHSKGIAAITLHTTLTIEELFSFHELIMEKHTPLGPALLELAEKKGLKDIKFSPMDLSKLKFVEGVTRKDGADSTFWEDYVSGLLEGRLADEEMDTIIDNVSSEKIAGVINERIRGDGSEAACDSVIHSYLGRRGGEDRKPELFGKFLSMVDNLTAELKQRFLTRSFTAPFMDADGVEKLLGELTFNDIDRMMKVFSEQSSLLPERLKTLVDKLRTSKTDISVEIRGGGISYVDDIEIDERVLQLLKEEPDSAIGDKRYHEELKKMTENPRVRNDNMARQLEDECASEIIDRTASKIMFELLKVDSNSKEEYHQLLSSLIDLANGFIETGRFSEISEIYTTILSHSLTGTFKEEASEMIEDFFGSRTFLLKLIDAFRVWGRFNVEEVADLSRILKNSIITPLLDALAKEENTSIRRFFLDLLCRIGGDVASQAAKRLDDERWHVARNMIYLVRECNGTEYISRIRQLAKHPDEKIAMEAVKTLLHFRTADSISHIRLYLHSKNPFLREQAARLAGAYRIKEAVSFLIELLEKKDLLGADSYCKVIAVKALAEIGEPSALKILHKICDSHTLLHKAEHDKLKIEIFRSLHNYPIQDVKPLLESGLKSKIKDIKFISERLLKSVGEKRD